MIIQQFKPSGILSQFIRYYWTLEAGNTEFPHTERVIPLGNIDLMFHYKNSFVVKRCDETIFTQAKSNLGGISSNFADVSTNGESGMICVAFYPFGACNFLDFPLIEIEEQQIGFENIYKPIKYIEEQLGNAYTMQERIAIIEKFLLSRLKPVPDKDFLLIKRSIDLINLTKGQLNTKSLCEKLSLSPKNLERKFKNFIGKTPKQFSKIIRFKNILNSFNHLHNNALTQVAYENGYFDQAHFIKDFKTFTGLTPGDYLKIPECNYDVFS